MSTLAIEAEVPVHPQIPCRFYAAGKCRYGSRGRNSHDFNAAVLSEPATHDTNIRVKLPSSHTHRTPRAQQTSLDLSTDRDAEVRQLDSERQSLVYNHHRELTAASDTIAAMKSRAESLDADLDLLRAAFSEISRLSTEIAGRNQ